MKYKGTLLAVRDMRKSLDFYRTVFGLEIVNDFGANKELTGGIFLQADELWRRFIERDVEYGNNDTELYFEEDDMDAFLKKLESIGADYVHVPKEHDWGQRTVRIYDPDRHIIEIGENMTEVVKRFAAAGMSVEEIALRMDVPPEYIEECIGK